jgi:hypothetical protein
MRFSAFVVIFMSLTGCINNLPYELDHTVSEKKAYRSSRLRFSESNYKEIELEILFLSNNIKCFLNFYHTKIKNEKDQLIKLQINEQEITAICFCMKGKQRLVIPDETSKILIDSLNDGKEISIIHNKSTISIGGQEFIEAYKKITKNKSIISTLLNTINQ